MIHTSYNAVRLASGVWKTKHNTVSVDNPVVLIQYNYNTWIGMYFARYASSADTISSVVAVWRLKKLKKLAKK